MQKNADQNAKRLFFAFIIVCVITAIFALGLISQGGGGTNTKTQGGWGISTKTQGGWGWGGDNDHDDDDHDDDDDDD
ncbi:MAG: hypothetical protein KAQ66_03065 [Rhodospirillaceae bacterium]|nr:hypothetical protein [Rhodospirillaceae bacterium]